MTIEQIRALVAAHLPGYEIRAISRLGAGLDNVAYGVNDEIVIRLRQMDDRRERAAEVRREADLLALVTTISTLPAPAPVFVDPEAGALACTMLPGRSLLERRPADPAWLAEPLGAFLSRLHATPLETVEPLAPRDTDPLETWRDDAGAAFHRISADLPPAYRRAAASFLSQALPPAPHDAVFCHNDLGTEHILVDDDAHAITGVIDWSDAAIADPVCDLALLYRDLGPDVFDRILASYDGTIDDAGYARLQFYARCRLLEDLAYGMTGGPRQYAGAALANFDHTFA
jgi:aminoglycoside phosphotransferase (APT) family kinase protein